MREAIERILFNKNNYIIEMVAGKRFQKLVDSRLCSSFVRNETEAILCNLLLLSIGAINLCALLRLTVRKIAKILGAVIA